MTAHLSKKHLFDPLPILSRQVPMRSSAAGCLAQCERKFMFRERYGLQPIHEYQSALAVGSLVHLYILQVLEHGDEEQAQAVFAAEIGRLQNQLLISTLGETGKLKAPPAWLEKRLAALRQDGKLAEMMAKIFLDNFVNTLQGFEIMSEFIESPLRWEIPGREAPLVGRLDMVLRDKKGAFWIWDLKTMSARFSSINRAKMFLMDPQPWFYKMLLRKALQERGYKSKKGGPPKVAGVFHVIFQKPGLSFCGKDSNFAAYVIRCKKDFFDKRFAEVRDGTREDPPVLVSRLPLGRIPSWVMTIINRLEVACAGPICDHAGAPLDGLAPQDQSFFGKWAPNCTACYDYNMPCQFLPLCSQEEKRWPGIIKQHYTQRFREDEEAERNSCNET